MGSILQRRLKNGKKGNRYIEWTDAQGKRRSETLKGEVSRTQAKLILKNREGEATKRANPEIFGYKRIRFEDFADDYLDYCRDNNEKSTVRTKGKVLKLFKKFFKGRYIDTINLKSVDEYKKSRRDKVAKSTINKETMIFQGMFTWAISRKLLQGKNPVAGDGVRIALPEKERRFLHRDELKRLYKVINSDFCSDKDRAFILLGLNTGMRIGEVLSLQWGEVDLAKGVIAVLNTKNKTNRYIPINQELREALEVLKKDENFVINNNGSQYVDHRKMLNRILKEADIEDFSYHGFRHTFISYLMMRGINVKAIQKLAGHKNIEETMRYAHLADDNLAMAVKELEFTYQGIRTEKLKSKSDVKIPVSVHILKNQPAEIILK